MREEISSRGVARAGLLAVAHTVSDPSVMPPGPDDVEFAVQPEKLASDGNDFGANTPQSLAAFIKSETEKYRLAVQISGTKLE